MVTKQIKNKDEDKSLINSAVVRVTGVVRVASATVAEAMAIKDEAVDEIEATIAKSNSNAGDIAVKKIETDSEKVLERR
jgi:hypothetical protein